MSIKLMTKVWENGPEDRTETMVLLALADRANDDGSSCYPSIADIKQRCRMSRSGVRKVVNRLEEKGYVTVHRGGGRNKTNNYQIHPGALNPRTTSGDSDENPGRDPENPGRDPEKPRTASGRNHQGTVSNRQESAPAREDNEFDPIRVLKDMWDVHPTQYQKDKVRQTVTDEQEWRDVLHELKMQNKDSKKAIGWALQDYEENGTGGGGQDIPGIGLEEDPDEWF